MQLPVNEKERKNVQTYLRSRKGDNGFEVLLSWFKSELHKRDEENRNVGQENRTSEAQGFAGFLEIVAACQAPEADRDQTDSSAGSMSAGPVM